jgi:Vps4 C terminal oligomerisation domain
MIDFQKALRQVRASVGTTELHIYDEWNKMYGSVARQEDIIDEDDDEIMVN